MCGKLNYGSLTDFVLIRELATFPPLIEQAWTSSGGQLISLPRSKQPEMTKMLFSVGTHVSKSKPALAAAYQVVANLQPSTPSQSPTHYDVLRRQLKSAWGAQMWLSAAGHRSVENVRQPERNLRVGQQQRYKNGVGQQEHRAADIHFAELGVR